VNGNETGILSFSSVRSYTIMNESKKRKDNYVGSKLALKHSSKRKKERKKGKKEK